MLLVAIVIGAKADDTVFLWQSDGSTTAKGTAMTATGGTATFQGSANPSTESAAYNEAVTDNDLKATGSKGHKLGTNTLYLELTLSSGTFKAGDKVYICGYNSYRVGTGVTSQRADTDIAASLATGTGKGDYNVGVVTLTEDMVGTAGVNTIYISRANGSGTGAAAVKVTRESSTTAPTITTDLSATANVTVGVAEEFSIVATGATSYQWYNGENAIEGATSATYSYTATAAGTVNLKCVASNSIGSTPSTVCAVTASAPASAPTITTDLNAAYDVIKDNTLELSIVAEGASSYQWYKDGVAIEGATSASYTFTAGSTIGATNEIYCSAINAAGPTNSTVATVTTVGRTDCQLLQVQYSNNFYAFITQPTEETPEASYTITSYYLEGEDVPTIVGAGVTVSAGATWEVEGNTLTVTAEDEVTTAEFTINAPVAVSPYTGLGEYTFTAADTWVKTGYSFGTESGKKGWKFAKNTEDDGKLRNADGRTRIYLFVGPCKTITLTSGCSSDRDIRVYRNGTEVLEKTKLAKNGGTVTFNGDESNACMYEVRSAQTGGDGTIEIMTVATTNENIEIDNSGVATYVTKQALDFSTQNGAFKAYVVTGLNAAKTSAQTAEVTQVPAGTPLLLKGAEGSYDVEVIASAQSVTNMLLASDGNVTGADDVFAYSKSKGKFVKVASTVTIPAGKAYLQIANAGSSLDIDFDGEATGVNSVAEAKTEVAPVKVIKNGKLYIGNYNVAGQQVK